MEFEGSAVRVARVFRAMSQQQLGTLVSAATSTIWNIEKGRQPGGDLLDALAIALGFEREFFFAPITDEFTENECSFRRRVSASERLRKSVLARGTLFGMVVRFLSRTLTLPKFNVPSIGIKNDEDVEAAAARCREHWGLGDKAPIKQMARVLEHAGVVVTAIEAAEKLDAFSRWGGEDGVNVVVLNTAKGSASRTRFDMAHELGHLVMHRDRQLPRAEREAQANRFASAFLLPRVTFAQEFWSGDRELEWMKLFEMKRRWGASVQAILYRAYDLRLIDAMQFRRAYKVISARGWLKQEPEEPEHDEPELFRKGLKVLAERKHIGPTEIAAKLHWTVETFGDVTGYRDRGQPTAPNVVSLDAFREQVQTAKAQ